VIENRFLAAKRPWWPKMTEKWPIFDDFCDIFTPAADFEVDLSVGAAWGQQLCIQSMIFLRKGMRKAQNQPF
jgi:hypothetical protein